ncbi:MAG: D-alanyl-D-alanine carboxypeptidase [Microbacteriaceae bacterium]
MSTAQYPSVDRRDRSRRRRGRRWPFLAGLLAALVAAGVYVPSALGAPLAQAAPELRTIEPAAALPVDLPWPVEGRAAIGLADGEGVLATNGVDDPGVLASITKMVANLVVLDARPLAAGESGPSITTTQRDVEHWSFWVADNASVQPVSAGLTFTQRELMELSLIPSAANYTHTLIDWAYGDMATFLVAARAWLDERGLDSISLADGTGLSPENVGTAADLVALARYAVAEPAIVEITGMASAEIPVVGGIRNTNSVLGIGGVTGLKTGYTVEAGYNLLFAATVDVDGAPVELVGAVLGGSSRAANGDDVLRLVAAAAANLHRVTVIDAGEELGGYRTAWGATTTAVASDDVELLLWGDERANVEVALDPIASAAEGDRVGSVLVTAPDGDAFTVDAVASGALVEADALWRLTNPAALFGG